MRENTLKLLLCAALVLLTAAIGYGLVSSTVMANIPLWPPPPVISVHTPATIQANIPLWPPPPTIRSVKPTMSNIPLWPPPPIVRTAA